MSAITPELALVDPELAAAARALLPDPGQFRPTPEGAAYAAVVALLAAAAVAAGAFGLLARHWDDRPAGAELAAAAPSALQERAMRQARAARAYTWPAVPGAEVYEVKIMRGRQPVYEATTRLPALELPAMLTLAPGRYTWSVTPRSSNPAAGLSARPVVEETFQVTSS